MWLQVPNHGVRTTTPQPTTSPQYYLPLHCMPSRPAQLAETPSKAQFEPMREPQSEAQVEPMGELQGKPQGDLQAGGAAE